MLVTGAVIDEITPTSVRWHGADGEMISPAATVISTGRTGELAVAESLASSGRPVHVVGDAAAVAGSAIGRSGHRRSGEGAGRRPGDGAGRRLRLRSSSVRRPGQTARAGQSPQRSSSQVRSSAPATASSPAGSRSAHAVSSTSTSSSVGWAPASA